MQVIIMRSISGFGKSTFVRQILPELLKQEPRRSYIAVCSSDKYFIKPDGVYRFVREKLGLAHKASRNSFQEYLNDDGAWGVRSGVLGMRRAVVVDNTNTRVKEIRPYYEMAENYPNVDKVTIYEIQPLDGDWDRAVDIGVQNNVHGVPREAIERMKDRILKSQLPKEWNRVIVKRGDGFFEIDGKRHVPPISKLVNRR